MSPVNPPLPPPDAMVHPAGPTIEEVTEEVDTAAPAVLQTNEMGVVGISEHVPAPGAVVEGVVATPVEPPGGPSEPAPVEPLREDLPAEGVLATPVEPPTGPSAPAPVEPTSEDLPAEGVVDTPMDDLPAEGAVAAPMGDLPAESVVAAAVEELPAEGVIAVEVPVVEGAAIAPAEGVATPVEVPVVDAAETEGVLAPVEGPMVAENHPPEGANLWWAGESLQSK